MTGYKFIVASNPVAGKEDEYNTWYDERHLPDLMKMDGIVGATRYELAEVQSPGTPAVPQYLAIYDIETDNLQGVFDEMQTRAASGEMLVSDALDLTTTYGIAYKKRSV